MKQLGLHHLLRLGKNRLRLVPQPLAPQPFVAQPFAPSGFVRPHEEDSSIAARVIGWTSLALGVAALGVYIGRELRIRYKFNHRTPYDYYAHSAEGVTAADYGIGI